MYNNGVSHLTAKDDITGVTAILQWLSYVTEAARLVTRTGLPVDARGWRVAS